MTCLSRARSAYYRPPGRLWSSPGPWQQLALWRHGDKLGRLTQRLVALHRELLTNSQAAELLLAQGLADIARVAGVRAR